MLPSNLFNPKTIIASFVQGLFSNMDLPLLASVPTFSFPRLSPSKIPISLVTSTRTGSVPTFQCKAATTEISSHPVVARRSGNYQPTIWHYDYIESLRSEYAGEPCSRRIDKLKGDVRMMLDKVVDPLEQLELIDILQRLGLSYHFEDQISRILEAIYTTNDGDEMCNGENLYATALKFRLLREHGYSMPQEIFNSFKNEKGAFKACLTEDIEGLLCLYEASFLLVEGESFLEEARDFATKQLEEYVEENKDGNLSAVVSHALDLPLRWRMLRLETRWFIDQYRRKEDMNPILLELAELDFNMVQAAHQEDLKDASRWWRSTTLGENLPFARDRLVENFLWTVALIFQPQFGYCRRMLARAIALITSIDDVYDVYCTLEELELFTDAVDKWDTNVDHLPYYMQISFHALHNFVNETAFDFLKEQRFPIVRYLKKAWANLFRYYLVEAKWYNIGYTPTLQEYIDHAWISISGPIILLHAYFFVTNPITKEMVDCLDEYPNIIRLSSIIFRLADDLGTSKDEVDRGDSPKAIQCYMKETGASEEEAREYIKFLIGETWKKMNEEVAASSPFSQTFIEIAMNIARMAQCMYQHGDGHGTQAHSMTKDRVLSLLVHSIPPHRDEHEIMNKDY